MLSYLIPSSGFEFLFFAVIFGSAVIIALLVRKYAKPDAWDNNWQSGTINGEVRCEHCNGSGVDPDVENSVCPVCAGSGTVSIQDADKDDLHPEHGSVFELADHVMTASEKCAEVLPSTLLVVGLLGTFLGVGMALDDAAGAIASTSASDVSVEAMQSLVDNMKGMIEGMGAQFKSSIYGIIASLLFTFWRSKYGSEQERVRWVLTKCNEENKQGDSAYQGYVCSSLKTLNDAMENVCSSVGKSLKDTISECYGDRNANLAKLLKNVANPSDEVLDSSRRLVEASSQMIDKIDRVAEAVESNLGTAAKAAEEMGEKSKEFNKAIVDCVPKLSRATEKMGKGMDKLVDDLVDGMIKKQDDLYNMVRAAEEQKLKAALSVNEVVENSIKNLAEINAGLTAQLDVLVKNLGDIRLDMAKMAGRDVRMLQPVGVENEKRDEAHDYSERVVKELQALSTSIQVMASSNDARDLQMISILKSIQTLNEQKAKAGLFKRISGWN
jgi:hypothetical protein